MICDLHVHVAGTVSPRFVRSIGGRLLARRFGGRDPLQQTLAWLDSSRLDRAVLLAFDAAHRDDGTRDWENSRLVTDNDFVADLTDRHEKVLFGASVHPYRPDALAELERVIDRGACLVKWLPAAQNIQPDDPRCIPFYEMLAHYRVPLLCHTGSEHILKVYSNSLNDPRRLVLALQRGVTVIAAHCGTRVFLHEHSYFRAWQELALQCENFYGDLSAFGLPLRSWSLRTLLREPALVAKLVFGSDFPVPTLPWSCVGQVGLRRARELGRIANPFDQTVETLKAAGMPAAVFARGAALLRLPEEVPV